MQHLEFSLRKMISKLSLRFLGHESLRAKDEFVLQEKRVDMVELRQRENVAKFTAWTIVICGVRNVVGRKPA